MKIAIAQIEYQPAYIGLYGSYTREPIFHEEPLVTELSVHSSVINSALNSCEQRYFQALEQKILAVFEGIEDKSVHILVFPEYSIHPFLLPLIRNKSIETNCICVAASHLVQSENQSYYDESGLSEHIKSNKGAEDVKKSCCPVFFPDGSSAVIFKEKQSKWENNIIPDNNSKIINFGLDEGESISIHLCIDALHLPVIGSKLLIVPAASPTIDNFFDVGRHLLTQEIITIFCNSASYGGSTIFCMMPKSSNIKLGDGTNVMPLGKNEEAILIVDIDLESQFGKRGSVQTNFPAKVDYVLPLLYKNFPEADLLCDIHDNLVQKNFDEVRILLKQLNFSGLTAEKFSLLTASILTGFIRIEEFPFYTDYVLVNSFPLHTIIFSSLRECLEVITQQFTSKPSSLGPNVINTLSILSREYERMSIKFPYISSTEEGQDFDDSQFQNRSLGLNLFKEFISSPDLQHKSLFVLEGIKGIGKTTLTRKLGKIFSFDSIIITLPQLSGWSRLLNSILSSLKLLHLDYIDPDQEKLNLLVRRITDVLKTMPRRLVVLRNCGHLFQKQHADYELIISFFHLICDRLNGTKVKIILLSDRKIDWPVPIDYWVTSLRIKEMGPLYIRRIIQYRALASSDTLEIPEIPQSLIEICHGSPIAAKLIGVHIGKDKNFLEKSIQNLKGFNRFNESMLAQLLDNFKLSNNELNLLEFGSIYRLPVEKSAFINYPGFTENGFNQLVERFLIEQNNDLYEIPPLIKQFYQRYYVYQTMEVYHQIAARYFSEILITKIHEGFSIEKAEFIYHSSFFNPQQGEKDYETYSDEILTISIELFKQNKSAIALSHLKSIEIFKKNNYIFHIYAAKCYANVAELNKVEEHLRQFIELYKGESIIWGYCSIIDTLIWSRHFDYAESLIMEAKELENLPQLTAQHIKLLYHKSSATKRQAIQMALELMTKSFICIRTSKILVKIFLQEGLLDEAQAEVKRILDVVPGEAWFKNKLYEIQRNAQRLDDDKFDDYFTEYIVTDDAV